MYWTSVKAERRKSLAISGLADFRSISDGKMDTDVKINYWRTSRKRSIFF